MFLKVNVIIIIRFGENNVLRIIYIYLYIYQFWGWAREQGSWPRVGVRERGRAAVVLPCVGHSPG